MLRKTVILIIGLLTLTVLTTQAQAKRGGFISYSYGTYITKVADLQAHAKPGQGNIPNLGWRHERVAVFGMPLWGTTEGQYVLYTEAGDGWRSIPVPPEMFAELSRELGLNLSASSPISIFSILWGWLVLGPIILFGIYGVAKGNRENAPQREKPNISDAELHAMAAQMMQQRAQQQTAPQQVMARPAPGQAPAFGKRR